MIANSLWYVYNDNKHKDHSIPNFNIVGIYFIENALKIHTYVTNEYHSKYDTYAQGMLLVVQDGIRAFVLQLKRDGVNLFNTVSLIFLIFLSH